MDSEKQGGVLMVERLDPSAERRLIAMGNKKYYRVLILTTLWSVAVVACWLAVMLGGQYSFARIPAYLPLLLCVLPFFPLGAHKILFAKTFYATVDHRVDYTQFQQLKEAYVHDRPETVEALSVKFKGDDGKQFSISFPKKHNVAEGIHYASGDRVLFVRGLSYPVKLISSADTERTCPVCGRTVEAGDTSCRRCGFDDSILLRS